MSDGKKESDSGVYWCIARNQVCTIFNPFFSSNCLTSEIILGSKFTTRDDTQVGSVRSRNATLQVGGKIAHMCFLIFVIFLK